MKYTQKLVLVPVEEWERIKNLSKIQPKETVTVNHQIGKVTAAATEVPAVNQEMKVQKKLKMENSIQNPNQKNLEILKPKKKKKKKKDKVSTSKLILPEKTLKKYRIKQVLRNIPENNRDKAMLLLQHITDYNMLKWNKDFLVKYNNKIIPKSNIVQLVKHALSKNDTSKPEGIEKFYTMLNIIDIPDYLILNQKALNKYNESGTKKYNANLWRPPGELVSKKKRNK